MAEVILEGAGIIDHKTILQEAIRRVQAMVNRTEETLGEVASSISVFEAGKTARQRTAAMEELAN